MCDASMSRWRLLFWPIDECVAVQIAFRVSDSSFLLRSLRMPLGLSSHSLSLYTHLHVSYGTCVLSISVVCCWLASASASASLYLSMPSHCVAGVVDSGFESRSADGMAEEIGASGRPSKEKHNSHTEGCVAHAERMESISSG